MFILKVFESYNVSPAAAAAAARAARVAPRHAPAVLPRRRRRRRFAHHLPRPLHPALQYFSLSRLFTLYLTEEFGISDYRCVL